MRVPKDNDVMRMEDFTSSLRGTYVSFNNTWALIERIMDADGPILG